MKKYTHYDTFALDTFLEEFKVKYNPSLYESHYAKFLELIHDMLADFRQVFEENFIEKQKDEDR